MWNDIVNWRTKRLNNSTKVSTPCIDDHHFKEEELKSVGELSKVCSRIVLKCLYLARIGRPDILWWTKAWPGRCGPQGMSLTGGGGPARVPNLRVCKHVWSMGVSSAWQKTSSETQRGRAGLLQKNCQVAATWHGDDSPHLSWKCAQVTGKAGDNGQNSSEMGGSSPWTRPSAPECGDTLEALAGDQRPIQGGDRPRRRLWGRY